MLLCNVAAIVLNVTAAVPVVRRRSGFVYDKAKVLPLVTDGLKKIASVFDGPRAKSGMPTATGGGSR